MIAYKTSAATRKTGRLIRSAFTLMEVLVVVAIIVVLAGVGTMYLLPRLNEAKDNTAKVNVTELTKAANTFELNNGRRPTSLAELAQPQPNGGKRLVSPDALKDPWGNDFQYNADGPRNGNDQPDIWTLSPEKKEIGNWPKGQ